MHVCLSLVARGVLEVVVVKRRLHLSITMPHFSKDVLVVLALALSSPAYFPDGVSSSLEGEAAIGAMWR